MGKKQKKLKKKRKLKSYRDNNALSAKSRKAAGPMKTKKLKKKVMQHELMLDWDS